MEKCKKYDWMANYSQLLNFYGPNSNAILNFMFDSQSYTIISKPISYVSAKTRRKQLLKKRWTFKVEC